MASSIQFSAYFLLINCRYFNRGVTMTKRLKNIVKLFLLSLTVWMFATTLPETFSTPISNRLDDSVDTPVAHLEDRLLELETNRRSLNTAINTMDSFSAAFKLALEELANIDHEIEEINAEMNQIWSNYNDDDYQVDDEYHDEYDSEYTPYEPFAPVYEEAPARMSDTEIASFAAVPLVDSIPISTWQDMRAFLNGTLGNNDDHFHLTTNIAITTGTTAGTGQGNQFFTTGRPGVFTGVLCGRNPAGGNFTITGLRLRASRTTAGAPAGDGTLGVGLIQQAGDGAVIRNINIGTSGNGAAADNDANNGLADNNRLAHFTAAHARSVGAIVGRTFGENAVVTIDNVHFTSIRAVPRIQMVHTTGASTGSWGGMVGQVGSNTTLNIRDVSIANIEINVSGGTILATGGLVGSVNGGTLNISTYNAQVNNINTDMRGNSRGNFAGAADGSTAAGNINAHTTGPIHGGGILGYVFSGHAAIYDTTLRSTRNALIDPIRTLNTAGGITGGLNVTGTLRLNNVENHALLHVQRQGGDGSSVGGQPRGRVGGLVGHSAGTLHIVNSRNFGTVQFQANRATIGGLVGYAGPSSITTIIGSRNNGALHHRNENSAGTHNVGTFAAMGGIIGRTRGRVNIENTENHGTVNKAALTNNATNRNNTGIGGIIGRATLASGQAFHFTNVSNHGVITLSSHVGQNGGLIAELISAPRGVGNVLLNDVRNYANIAGGASIGGIIGISSPRDVVIRNAVNEGNLNRHASGARPLRAGGIVGRAGGAGFRIETARNYGSIINLTAAGAVAGDAVDGATNAGGIIGHSTGIRLIMNDTYNDGDVRGRDNAGGILGLAGGNDTSVNFAINHGEIYASRSGGAVRAGGIVGFSRRRNILIRNTGNFGIVRLRGGNNNNDGVAGILGRSQGANARIEVSFNQGTISGRNSAGGIVGRNQGTLNITDVYNIGQVTGHATSNSARSGNGILGRRRTGTVRITRAWISARLGGYAVATSQAGTGQQNANGAITGITFTGVFVDGTTFVTTGTGFQANNPAIQRNRNGINEVDTELLTSGLLPGFNSGPWRTGIAGVDLEHQRTYPYFNWQIPDANTLQAPFFSFIRSIQPFQPSALQLEEDLEQPLDEEYGFLDEDQLYDEDLDLPYEENELYQPYEVDELDQLLEEYELIELLDENNFEELGIHYEPEVEYYQEKLNEEYDLFDEYDVDEFEEESYVEEYEEESDLDESDEEYKLFQPLEEEGYRRRPVMDLQLPTPASSHQIDFDFSCDFVDYFELNIPCEPLSRQGTRVFNTYIVNGFTAVPTGVNTHQISLTRAGYTSIGLISNNGVVGFEARDVIGRIVIRGYDPLFGENPNYYINHTYFRIVSADASDVDLNSLFFDCAIDAYPCPPQHQVDSMRGMGLIRFIVDDDNPGEIESGLNPRPGPAYNPNSASSDSNVAASLADYTVVRITALGYRPAYRIIYTGDMNHLSTGTISVPMERVPFPIRVWVPQTNGSEDIDDDDEDEYAIPLLPGLPGTPGVTSPANTPINARPGFPVRSGHAPGSFLAMDPILRHTSNTPGHNHGNGAANTSTVETGNAYPSGHFDVRYAMWGDTFIATAPQHTTNTLEVLRFEHLLDRGAGTVSTPNLIGPAVDEPILDLDLYIENLGLAQMYFRFVEITGINDDGDMILRNLSIDGSNAAGAGVMPVIQLQIHNEPNHAQERFNANTTVHNPQYANNAGGNSVWVNQLPALSTMGTPTPHIRVTGIAEDTSFSVTDTAGEFLPLVNEAVSNYFNWFEPLINIDEAREDDYGDIFTFADERTVLAGNTARTTQLDAAIDSGERGDPYLIRTLTIPLVRMREFEVRVVERTESGVYSIIENSILHQNDNAVATNQDRPGTFTLVDEIANVLDAEASGFYPGQVNAYTGAINGLLVTDNEGNSYIRIVLEPRFFEIEFDLQGGANEEGFLSQTVRHGQTVAKPTEAPTSEGYRFGGWYADSDGNTEFNFDSPIMEETTVYARWISVTEFEFTKVNQFYDDMSHEEFARLEGAMFNLYIWEDEDWVLLHEDIESDEDGLVSFGEIDSDNLFKLVETFAPEGFRSPVGHWYVNIDDNRTIVITRSLDDDEYEFEDVPFVTCQEDDPCEEGELFVGNMLAGIEFSFTKTNEYLYIDMEDDNFYHLGGARFELSRYVDGEWEYIETADSANGANLGLVVFEYLLTVDGVYRLDETRPPAGFRPPHGYWVITWDAEAGRFHIEAHGTIALVPAFREVEQEEEVNLYLGNFRETLLPASGGFGTMSMALIGILLLSVVAMLYIRRRIAEMEELAEVID